MAEIKTYDPVEVAACPQRSGDMKATASFVMGIIG